MKNGVSCQTRLARQETRVKNKLIFVDLCGYLWIFVDICVVDICGYSIQSFLPAHATRSDGVVGSGGGTRHCSGLTHVSGKLISQYADPI